MERFGEVAQNIINGLHTERIDYHSEYLPLINAANQLVDFEGFDRTTSELASDLEALAAYRRMEQSGEMVRVVRCKDCKSGRMCYNGFAECIPTHIVHGENYNCGHGERREQE